MELDSPPLSPSPPSRADPSPEIGPVSSRASSIASSSDAQHMKSARRKQRGEIKLEPHAKSLSFLPTPHPSSPTTVGEVLGQVSKSASYSPKSRCSPPPPSKLVSASELRHPSYEDSWRQSDFLYTPTRTHPSPRSGPELPDQISRKQLPTIHGERVPPLPYSSRSSNLYVSFIVHIFFIS